MHIAYPLRVGRVGVSLLDIQVFRDLPEHSHDGTGCCVISLQIYVVCPRWGDGYLRNMDSVTHIVFGACIGEAVLGRSIGRKAMLWGAAAQSLPDIDFVAGFWMDLPHELLAHRGFTHSILFLLLAAPALGIWAERLHRPHDTSLRRFIAFFAIEMGAHLFLDACNNYGVGWFEPFTDHRISFNCIYVADPFFTLIPGIAGLVLAMRGEGLRPVRMRWALTGIFGPMLYLLLAASNKLVVERSLRKQAVRQGIRYDRHFTTPAPLNSWLWYMVLEDAGGYRVGYRSVLDGDKPLDLRFFPRNDSLLQTVHDHEEVMLLKKFSQGYYTVEQRADTLLLNDLRFGRIVGWEDPGAGFVFHYYITHPEDNDLIVQRGRFAGWNLQTPIRMWRRIRG